MSIGPISDYDYWKLSSPEDEPEEEYDDEFDDGWIEVD